MFLCFLLIISQWVKRWDEMEKRPKVLWILERASGKEWRNGWMETLIHTEFNRFFLKRDISEALLYKLFKKTPSANVTSSLLALQLFWWLLKDIVSDSWDNASLATFLLTLKKRYFLMLMAVYTSWKSLCAFLWCTEPKYHFYCHIFKRNPLGNAEKLYTRIAIWDVLGHLTKKTQTKWK